MVFLVLSMLAVTALAVAVVGLVAVPAHRDGRDVLTPEGERVAREARRHVPRGTRPRTH